MSGVMPGAVAHGHLTKGMTQVALKSALSHLECSASGAAYNADELQGVSELGKPLLARYDLEQVKATVTRADIALREPTLWRYREVLPVRDESNIVSLGEGYTPLLPAPRLGRHIGLPNLMVKDEGLLPTGTFKARGAAVGVSRAKELGATRVAMPTNGNAGAAWATYASRAGIRSLVVMPEDAPTITREETSIAGGELHVVPGVISDAAAYLRDRLASYPDAQDVSTLKEPYRLEGKKTMAYEIAEQLGWEMPDVILYPTGGGVGLIGIHKAVQEMHELGWVTKVPRLVAVQADGCAPIVEAFKAGWAECRAPAAPYTVAFGINVPKPLGDFLILSAVRESGGTALSVSDDALLEAQSLLGRTEGMFVCPEGAACIAALLDLKSAGWLNAADKVVVLNTGTGIKYPSSSLDTRPHSTPRPPTNGLTCT